VWLSEARDGCLLSHEGGTRGTGGHTNGETSGPGVCVGGKRLGEARGSTVQAEESEQMVAGTGVREGCGSER
jgi:hypothetical protein